MLYNEDGGTALLRTVGNRPSASGQGVTAQNTLTFQHPSENIVCRDSSVGIATRYGLDGPGIESRWDPTFSAPLQTGPGAHPASCTVGTGSFPGVTPSGRGINHPLPCNIEVKERVELYLYSPSGPSWPVIWWILPLLLPCNLTHVFLISICISVIQLAVTALAFDKRLPEDGHCMSKHVGGVSDVWTSVFLLLYTCWNCYSSQLKPFFSMQPNHSTVCLSVCLSVIVRLAYARDISIGSVR